MRIAILTQGLTGYLDACCRALYALDNELLVVAPRTNENTDFTELAFDRYAQTLIWTNPPSSVDLVATVDTFRPDVVIMVSWSRPLSYRAVMKSRHPSVLRVLLMDNLWRNRPKQWLGRATHRLYLDPVFDCVMVPSGETEWFARRLGFGVADVIRGAWSGDVDLFTGPTRTGTDLAAAARFLAIGRLVKHKGADVLAEAYQRYRDLVATPWDLDVVGVGELADRLISGPGVRMHGFLQPPEVSELMHSASAFVLPSRGEPFGIVVHEAATAGLPLVLSHFTGSAPSLLQDGYNGWTVPAGDADALARAMARMSDQSPERLAAMSAVSRALSTRYSPSGWSRNLHEEFTRRLAERRGRLASRRLRS